MPRVNTTSVREELKLLRSEYERLSSQGKVSAEVKMLIQGMFLLFEVLVSVFLEKTTKKNSRNSSLSSSQTEKDDSSTTAGSKSKRPEELLNRFPNSRTVERVRKSKVNDCSICGEDLRGVPCLGHERRTKIDIVFEKVVERVDAEIKSCPSCNKEVRGEFPSDMSGPLQYGNGLKAWLISLVTVQMVALGRVRQMMQTLIGGVALAESTILKYVWQLYLALEPWEASAKVAVLGSQVMHSDETSLRVEKQNYWVHVYSAGEITLKYLHRKRGKEAVEDIGILPLYGGVVVHDCWASYFSYDNCMHALCGSHLLRELTFVVDSNAYTWAREMKSLLKAACKKVSLRKGKRLTSKEYAKLQKRYLGILTRGEKEMPPILERSSSSGRRGKLAKSDAHNLLERLEKHKDGVLLFAKIAEVPFTNNRAERDLRMGKVKQKVSGCFRNKDFALAYCRISSYITTMANRGINPLIAIQIALAGRVKLEI